MKYINLSNRDKLLVIRLLKDFKYPVLRIRQIERKSTAAEYLIKGKVSINIIHSITGNVSALHKYD